MDIKINNLLSFHPVDYWDFEFQLTTGNRQLLKKYASQVGSAQQEIFASIYTQRCDLLFWNQDQFTCCQFC